MGSCLGSLPFVFLNDMFFTLFFFGDFCVSICDFERGKYKYKIFVFEFRVLVATLVRLKNMILGFLFLGFYLG